MTGSNWQRLGGLMGLLFVVLTLATFASPDTPDKDRPSAEIVQLIADDRTGLVLTFYVSSLAFIAFLVFVAALWSRLRLAEQGPGASMLALAGGVAVYVGVLLEEVAYLALINAADAAREPEAVRALFELHETVVIPLRFAVTAFFVGVALSAIPTRSLPRTLGWSAAVLALFNLLGLLGAFGSDVEEGPFVVFLALGRLGLLVWVIAASFVLLRQLHPAAAGAASAAAVAR